jgi:hypothetical protein
MQITNHASKRCRQRALPDEVLDLLMSLGNEFKSHHGSRIKAFASKFAKKEFLQELKSKGIQEKEKWCDAYIVIGPCETVITAGYRYKKLLNQIH